MEVLVVLALVVFSPIKIVAWWVGLLCGNIADGFHRGWEMEKPYGDMGWPT